MREDFTLTVKELKTFLANKSDDAVVLLNVSGNAAPAVGHVESADKEAVVITGGDITEEADEPTYYDIFDIER